MPIFAVHLHGGRIGLMKANDLDSAERTAYGRQGTDNVAYVEEATPEDIAWVRSMGGYVPKE